MNRYLTRLGIAGKTQIILTVGLLVSNAVFTQTINPDLYPIVPIDSLVLTRTATQRTASQLASYNLDPAYKGFKWDTDDNATVDWWPQGITGLNVGSSQFLVVSWYDNADYPIHTDNKGARLSFVNITDMNNIKYRHVLLVDENYHTFPGMHAGGLFIVGDDLFVSGLNSSIYKFNLNSIKLVPAVDHTHFKGYVYILARTGGESSPVWPSFVSYDYDQQKMLVGTYNDCTNQGIGDPYCNDNSLNTVGWYSLGDCDSTSPYYSGFIGRMQGMASKRDPVETNRSLVWIATSTGSGTNSHLFAFSHHFEENTLQGQVANMGVDFIGYTLAPGLEDLYLEENGRNLWSLTEFPDIWLLSPHDRAVFCFDVADIPPPIHRYTQDKLGNNTYSVNTEFEYVAATNYVAIADFVLGRSNWIKCDTIVPSLVSSDRSVFAWIWKNTNVSGGSEEIVGMNTADGGNLCNLEITGNMLAVYDGATLHSTGITVTDGQWHFVGYTYNNSTNLTMVYVDGVVRAAYLNDQRITSGHDRISIGQEYDGDVTSNFFNGCITEVSFWNAVLDTADISLIMSRTINSTHPKYSNLQAYYPMLVVEGEDNFIVKDFSGHGYDGIASMRTIQQQTQLVEIPGYNSIDHFDVSWMKNQSVISTTDTLRFIADEASSGTYLLKLSMSDFTVTDSFDLAVTVGVEEDKDNIPTVFQLFQNSPNPFNPITNVRYQLPVESWVTLRVFNTLGQLVSVLKDEVQPAGYRSVTWDASTYTSGIYFYTIEAVSSTDPRKTFTQVKKMLLVK